MSDCNAEKYNIDVLCVCFVFLWCEKIPELIVRVDILIYGLKCYKIQLPISCITHTHAQVIHTYTTLLSTQNRIRLYLCYIDAKQQLNQSCCWC